MGFPRDKHGEQHIMGEISLQRDFLATGDDALGQLLALQAAV
jgi:hypothetical protein